MNDIIPFAIFIGAGLVGQVLINYEKKIGTQLLVNTAIIVGVGAGMWLGSVLG